MTQNNEAERKWVRFADGIIPPGTVIGSFFADEHDDKAIFAEVITPAPEAADLTRTQAERIAELEAANRGLVRLSEATQARAEAAEAGLAEMTRRRDEWRKKAEGYDAVRLALREKVGTPWPPHMSRLMWAGIAADEKKRADDAEAEVARLREALGDIDAMDPEHMIQGCSQYAVKGLVLRMGEIARAALAQKEAGE